MTDLFVVPDEFELVGFFGAEPVERSPEDGYWCYAAVDGRGITLRFSFNVFERSVQTTLLVAGMPLAIVAHEGAERMRISKHVLSCEFSLAGARTTLTLKLGRAISLEWSSLRVS